MCWVVLAVTVVGAAYLYWGCARLKVVWLEDGFLGVSNYLRTERIPLADVESIRAQWWINIHPVRVRFARDTGFGRSIIFMPPLRLLNWLVHPVVEELRAAVEAQRADRGYWS